MSPSGPATRRRGCPVPAAFRSCLGSRKRLPERELGWGEHKRKTHFRSSLSRSAAYTWLIPPCLRIAVRFGILLPLRASRRTHLWERKTCAECIAHRINGLATSAPAISTSRLPQHVTTRAPKQETTPRRLRHPPSAQPPVPPLRAA